MVEKFPIDVKQFLYDSFVLAKQVYDSGFRPDFLVALWRGGTPVGIAVHEYFTYKGVKVDHAPPVRTEKYSGIDTENETIGVFGLEYLVAHANAGDSVLYVDDIYDTGESIQAVELKWERLARRNFPNEIKTATVYYKPKRNRTKRIPDYFVHVCDDWRVFPHETVGLTLDEIKDFKGERIAKLFEK